MASNNVQRRSPFGGSFWKRIPWAVFNLCMAVLALWLGMSVPSYFRSVSPLVLEAAAADTPDLPAMARQHLQGGRPGLAKPLLLLEGKPGKESQLSGIRTEIEAMKQRFPKYTWSGGPAPFYEQFLEQAQFLRSDETSVIPNLLPAQHRATLLQFLRESPNRNVLQILNTRDLQSWQRFYPVYSTSGQPLEATLLTVALLEQASVFQPDLQESLQQAVAGALAGDPRAMESLETLYIGILTIGRHADWLQLKALVLHMKSREELLFTAQAIQEDPGQLNLLLAATLYGIPMKEVVAYLHRHGDRGWASLGTALVMGQGAVEAMVAFDKPLYHPPAFWSMLPEQVHDGQQRLKSFAEAFPQTAILIRVLAFGLCGAFLVGVLRVLVLGPRPPGGKERRLLINLDSLVGSVLVTLLVWVLIEPGLLDFRPNEQGSLQIKLAQPASADSLTQIENATSAMLDQVTILVLLLFFVAQLLVFIFGLLKIAEIRRRPEPPQTKLHLLDNEEVLFDLGLYVGLGGTVASLILVVLNVVDASLMAAYASTLFGIIFVAILKIAFLRPFRRQLILNNQ